MDDYVADVCMLAVQLKRRALGTMIPAVLGWIENALRQAKLTS
jgi:hypothetical protein